MLRATSACTFSTSQLPKVVRSWVFFAFSLANVLRATTACNFSSLIWPAGSAPAALASLLFDPPEPQIIGKNTVFRDFPTFSRICIFFLLTLSLLIFSLLIFLFSLPLPCSAFHLSILSEVWFLNFLRLYTTWATNGFLNAKKGIVDNYAKTCVHDFHWLFWFGEAPFSCCNKWHLFLGGFWPRNRPRSVRSRLVANMIAGLQSSTSQVGASYFYFFASMCPETPHNFQLTQQSNYR